MKWYEKEGERKMRGRRVKREMTREERAKNERVTRRQKRGERGLFPNLFISFYIQCNTFRHHERYRRSLKQEVSRRKVVSHSSSSLLLSLYSPSSLSHSLPPVPFILLPPTSPPPPLPLPDFYCSDKNHWRERELLNIIKSTYQHT